MKPRLVSFLSLSVLDPDNSHTALFHSNRARQHKTLCVQMLAVAHTALERVPAPKLTISRHGSVKSDSFNGHRLGDPMRSIITLAT